MFGFLKDRLKDLKKKILGSGGEQEEIKVKEEQTEKVERSEIGSPKSAGKGEKKISKPKEGEKSKKKPGKKKTAHAEKEKKIKKKTGMPEKISKEKRARIEKAGKPKTETKERLITKLKRAISKKVKISDEELDEYLWDLELILLEADVAHEVVEKIISKLREKLSGSEFDSRQQIFDQIVSALRQELLDMIPDRFDPLNADNKPTIIVFIGPNGAGKTTTMAKLAKKVLDLGRTVIFAASDTFRAASIEQLEEHAKKLGVRVIKHKYGADPAAVAYDAVQSAKARGVDFVFVDTAGRQETNRNLLEELKKIKRVINPHYIIYVDEAVAGNVIYTRLEQFGELGISGVILTKMDVDTKGGGVITAAGFGIPILYVGVGQGYDDLKPFDKEEFVDSLLP